MSFSIGSSSPGMGPRTVLENFGGNQREGEMFNRDVVKRMLQYLKPYRWRMGLALFLTILESRFNIIVPLPFERGNRQLYPQGEFSGIGEDRHLSCAHFYQPLFCECCPALCGFLGRATYVGKITQ